MKNTLLAICFLLILQACNNEKSPEKDLSIIPLKTDTAINTVMQTQAVTAPVTTALPTATVATENNVAKTQAVNINPAHGLPGHDCSKPVGANLNAVSTREAVKPMPVANMVAPKAVANAVKASNAKGLNPAHGQPGHDCSKPVGASLSGETVATNTTSTNTTNTTNANVAIPALQNVPVMGNSQTTVNSNTTAKLNPAHGQPGHDCKVAVGQPLP